MPAYPIPETLEIDGEPYNTFVRPNGQGRLWASKPTPAQPGDVGRPKPYPLEFHGGFGFSRRYTGGDGRRIGAGHHASSQNVNVQHAALMGAAPRITYIDMGASAPSTNPGGFQLGGYTNSQLGGGGGALGGGTYVEGPQYIREYGDGLYVGCGSRTFTLDPSATPPSVEETRSHSLSARARSADVFDNQLVVALGSNVFAEVATAPWASGGATVWATSEVKMQVVKTGGGGRLFTARSNLIFGVEPGGSPISAAAYTPSAGEPISDETDPVRSLDEYLAGIVAGTTQQVRTLDPDGGFLGRGLTPRTRVSSSDFAGRSLIAVGSDLYFFTQRAAWLFRPGQPPVDMGFGLLNQNNTPYVRGVPGVPDFDGERVYVPYYFSSTGDSVIFSLKKREQGDVGEGPVCWQEYLYLEDRICRTVRYWGGSASQTARIFFGAETTASPESIGFIDVCDAPGPLFFRPGVGQPALTGVLTGGLDDFGTPGVTKGLDRIDLPFVEDVDANNYLVVEATADGSTYQTLYQTAADANGRIVTEGHAVVRPRAAAQLSGTEIGTRWTFTQASAATVYALVRGLPLIYLYDMPSHVEERTTLLELPDGAERETAEEARARLATLIDADPFQMKHTGGRDIWARMRSVDAVEFMERGGGEDRSVWAVQVVFVEIEVS